MTRVRTWLVAWMSGLLDAAEQGSRLTAAGASFVEGLALGALSEEELMRLTFARFSRSRASRDRELFEWERPWLERDLPAPPARVLVGGAGRGRESRWLASRGYDVVAFDPARDQGADILRLAYEDLTSAGPPRAALKELRALAPYDAVLLGWGSFTHVPGESSRLEILRALRRLSDGPVLLSYWRTRTDSGAPVGRSRSLGRKLGRLMAVVPVVTNDRDRVVAHAGYAHCFTDEEIRGLAHSAGYRVESCLNGFPHATLWPVDA